MTESVLLFNYRFMGSFFTQINFNMNDCVKSDYLYTFYMAKMSGWQISIKQLDEQMLILIIHTTIFVN